MSRLENTRQLGTAIFLTALLGLVLTGCSGETTQGPSISTGAAAPVDPKVPPSELARETVKFLELNELILVTAVRQQDKDDFIKFITRPSQHIRQRWDVKNNPTQRDFIGCPFALAHYENYAEDMFKAGKMSKQPTIYLEAKAMCSAMLDKT